jgi:hypothetical protein
MEYFHALLGLGANRLDRIYTTWNLSSRKISGETVAAAFTDYLALIIIGYPPPRCGRGCWKMNVSLLEETVLKEKLRQQWAL